MQFESIQNMNRYYEEVERRYHDGSLVPTSPEGYAERDRMVNAISDLTVLVSELRPKILSGDDDAYHYMIQIMGVRTGIAMLIGKFEGFRYGQSYFVARSGVFGQQFM